MQEYHRWTTGQLPTAGCRRLIHSPVAGSYLLVLWDCTVDFPNLIKGSRAPTGSRAGDIAQPHRFARHHSPLAIWKRRVPRCTSCASSCPHRLGLPNILVHWQPGLTDACAGRQRVGIRHTQGELRNSQPGRRNKYVDGRGFAECPSPGGLHAGTGNGRALQLCFTDETD